MLRDLTLVLNVHHALDFALGLAFGAVSGGLHLCLVLGRATDAFEIDFVAEELLRPVHDRRQVMDDSFRSLPLELGQV